MSTEVDVSVTLGEPIAKEEGDGAHGDEVGGFVEDGFWVARRQRTGDRWLR